MGRRGRRADRRPQPVDRRARRIRADIDAGTGRCGGRRGQGRLPGLARHLGAGAGGDLPPGVRHVHGAQRGDRPDDLDGGRQDDPRVAGGDGGVHGRPLPAGVRGRAAPHRCRAPVDPGADDEQADPGRPGADRRDRRSQPVELPRGHRRHPDRLRPGARLHGRLEAVRVRAAVRPDVHAAAVRRRLPAGHDQRRARPRRDRRPGRPPSGRRLDRVHRLRRDRREGRARRRPQEPGARAGRQRPADRAWQTAT